MSTSQHGYEEPNGEPTLPLQGYSLEQPSGKTGMPNWLTPARAVVTAIIIGLLILVGVLAIRLGDANAELAEIEAERAAAAALEAEGVGAFETALGACAVDAGQNSLAQISDGGSTLILPGSGKKSSGLRYPDQQCVLEALDAPTSFLARLGATRALDGTQTATWSNVEASWTYHPDSGLDIIITKN